MISPEWWLLGSQACVYCWLRILKVCVPKGREPGGHCSAFSHLIVATFHLLEDESLMSAYIQGKGNSPFVGGLS